MPFTLKWTVEADEKYKALKLAAETARSNRAAKPRSKQSKQEGLFKQIAKAILLLKDNPRHPGLCSHEYSGFANPFDEKAKVWEAYAQNDTPGAYRIFWCYGPGREFLTILAITPHP
jgi:hypothetical protein